MIFSVIRKSDQVEVSRYAAMQVVEGNFPLAAYEHVVLPEGGEAAEDTRKFGGRRILTKLEFRSLFPAHALKAIDRFEAQFEQSQFLTDEQKDDIRTAFKDYNEAEVVDLDHPRWPAGLGMYVALGMMTTEEVAEVLNG